MYYDQARTTLLAITDHIIDKRDTHVSNCKRLAIRLATIRFVRNVSNIYPFNIITWL